MPVLSGQFLVLPLLPFAAAPCGERQCLWQCPSGSLRRDFQIDEQRLEKPTLRRPLSLSRLISGVASRRARLTCMPAFARINKGDDPAFDTWVLVHHSRFGEPPHEIRTDACIWSRRRYNSRIKCPSSCQNGLSFMLGLHWHRQ